MTHLGPIEEARQRQHERDIERYEAAKLYIFLVVLMLLGGFLFYVMGWGGGDLRDFGKG